LLARRSFITGALSLLAAPAIVRAGSLMPVRALKLPDGYSRWIIVSVSPIQSGFQSRLSSLDVRDNILGKTISFSSDVPMFKVGDVVQTTGLWP
jgi:hypothetical protein